MDESEKLVMGVLIVMSLLFIFLIVDITYYNNYIEEQDSFKCINNITMFVDYSFNVTYHEEEGYFTLSED